MADEQRPPSSPSAPGSAGEVSGSVTTDETPSPPPADRPAPAEPARAAASEQVPRTASRSQATSAGDVIEYVKTYAKQETVGPLKGAGQWVGMGAAGAIAMGIGLWLLMLGLLRLLQSESFGFEGARLTFLNYAIVLVVCLVLLALVLSRINKTFLNKEDK